MSMSGMARNDRELLREGVQGRLERVLDAFQAFLAAGRPRSWLETKLAFLVRLRAQL